MEKKNTPIRKLHRKRFRIKLKKLIFKNVNEECLKK